MDIWNPLSQLGRRGASAGTNAYSGLKNNREKPETKEGTAFFRPETSSYNTKCCLISCFGFYEKMELAQLQIPTTVFFFRADMLQQQTEPQLNFGCRRQQAASLVVMA